MTDESVARQVLTDPRIAKDTALAPQSWRDGGDLEPTAGQRPSLTTLDGPAHARLRTAHAPLLSRRRLAADADRIAATARGLLRKEAAAGTVVDLAADFTTRYPLTVILDLVGVHKELLDDAASACRGMVSSDPAARGAAFDALNAVTAGAVHGGHDGIGSALRKELRDEYSDEQIGYFLFGLVFAGQLTTDAALGFLLAHALDPGFGLADADRDRIDALWSGCCGNTRRPRSRCGASPPPRSSWAASSSRPERRSSSTSSASTTRAGSTRRT
ncbi:cytochrome P450 [Pseudonocardia sp. KRD291]|uniref:cytochrome P450 n=1 Tax=Pseudonocardia sp. KRD291 TaxID=2792007 RepID=UPI001C4A1B2D|nr:cytochrome P450 [Pseudonocardia sp. KRD291]MBW0102667.1 cytochrome P450 [Pseudonocardia sp. KRD291]